MTEDEAIAALDAVEDHVAGDPEDWHVAADKVLLAMVPPAVAEAYRRLVDRAPWWSCA